jgi:hypothetical protein
MGLFKGTVLFNHPKNNVVRDINREDKKTKNQSGIGILPTLTTAYAVGTSEKVRYKK